MELSNNIIYDGFAHDAFNLIVKSQEIISTRAVKANEGLETLIKEIGNYISAKNIEALIDKEAIDIMNLSTISFMPLNRLNMPTELAKAKELVSLVMSTGQFTSGEYVGVLENEIRKYFNIDNCVATSSGTDGLIIALHACGVRAGDEVIVPANSFAATENAVFALSAIPIYADVDDNFNLSPLSVERVISSKTKCIVPVCLYGRLPQLTELTSLAAQYKDYAVLDAAQCFGVSGVTKADITVFSFNPFKNFGVFGKGGAVITANPELRQTG